MTEGHELAVFDEPASVARAVAERVISLGTAAIEQRGRFDIALAGGSTPKATYALLTQDPARAKLDWSLVRFFFGDERCVAPTADESNYNMAKATLLDPLQIRPHAVFRMLGEADPASAADAYAESLRHELGREPVLDLVMLGMGPDGHTASLFPGEDPLTDDADLVRAPWVEKFGSYRLTMTPHVINRARNVLVATEGASKATALKAVFDGPFRPADYPVQIVAPRSGRLTWFVDRAAAAHLRR